MVEERKRQDEGQHPNPQGQNVPGQSRPEEQSRSRDAAPPENVEREGKGPELNDEEIAQAP